MAAAAAAAIATATTALHIAVSGGNAEIVSLLLAAPDASGAIAAVCDCGAGPCTPLALAVRLGDRPEVEALLRSVGAPM